MDYKEANKISDILRQPLVDKGVIEVTQNGATITPTGKQLSQGCQACKSAAWICIYIGVDCNLACAHCPQLSRHKTAPEYIWANGGDDTIHYKDDIDRVLRRNPQITGISFSGGEPFKYFDTMVEWLEYINKKWPNRFYIWVYTNGTLVKESQLKKLAELKVQEIRFDHAATSYSNKVLETMKLSKKYIKYLTVEIPLLPKLQSKLLDTLNTYNEVGIDYLQLHELQLCEDNFERLKAEKVDIELNYTNQRGSWFNLHSMFHIYEVINYIIDHDLNIIFNDCSSRNYINQALGFQLQKNNMDPQFAQEEWDAFYTRAIENKHTP